MGRRLIVGLGNPGAKYATTRHNLGFIVVSAFAKQNGLSFKKESRFMSEEAVGKVREHDVSLLMPLTYMNLSGGAVRRVCDYYKIPFEDETSLLVVVDDIYVRFGAMRLKEEGSAGGHNGLKNIEEHLQTRHYARLRMGIGPEKVDERGPLEEYVLSTFTAGEMKALPQFVESGAAVLEQWVNGGWEAAKKAVGMKKTEEE